MTAGALLFLAATGLVGGMVSGPRFARLWLTLTLVGVVAGLGAALLVLGNGADWQWRSGFLVGGETLHFRLDALSAIFLVLLSIVGGAGAVYARGYWPDQNYPSSAPRGRLWWCGLVLSMGLVLVSSNGLHFLIAWEMFTVCAFFLITMDPRRGEARKAGWLFLVSSHAGTVCLFAFFGTLAERAGSWDLGPMREQAGSASLFWLALAGFGVKAGMFPLHIWLPSAHANAPSHVSAIMSGVALKMGIYGILRFSGWMPVPMAAGWVVMGLGAASALIGIAFALAQNDLKRLLAYCSVENIGIILVGIGAALLGAAHGNALWGRLALAGALLHVWNHGAFKPLLFFGAGSVLHATGTREMSRLGGLWRTMPWTAGLFALGAIAVCGLPPLNGFVSEWLLYLGLFDAAAAQNPSSWPAIPVAITLAVAGAIAVAAFAKAGAVVFLGAPRTQSAEQAHECGLLMRGPMMVMAALCLAIGLAPVLFWPAVSRAIGVWNPIWADASPPVSLTAIGAAQAALAVLACGAGACLWWKAHANGLRRGLTWDCGYAAPAARMQYTSGSFGGLASGWFVWLLQPERKIRRPRGPLPGSASRIERIPETVLERVIAPVGGVIMRASAAARRLQHGRLQAYIVYVVAALLAVGILVVVGGGL